MLLCLVFLGNGVFLKGLLKGFFCISFQELRLLRRASHWQLIQMKPVKRPPKSLHWPKRLGISSSLALVHLISSWLVYAECRINVALPKGPINQFKPVQKSRQRHYELTVLICIYTVPFLFKVSGLDLGKELALIEEGVLGSTTKPRSSSLLSVDFDLLCLK